MLLSLPPLFHLSNCSRHLNERGDAAMCDFPPKFLMYSIDKAVGSKRW